MTKKSDDPLFQNESSNYNAKKFGENITKAIQEYLDFKEEMSKYVLWDKVKTN